MILVSRVMLRQLGGQAVVLSLNSAVAAGHWSPAPQFAEKHWRIKSLAQRWAMGRETLRLLVREDPEVIKISLGRKKAHITYLIPSSVAQRIHDQLAGSISNYDQVHYRIQDMARLWALGREKVRLLIKDEPGVMKFRQGRKKAHTIYSVPESVARRIYTRLQNAA